MNAPRLSALAELRQLCPEIEAAILLAPSGDILEISADETLEGALGPVLSTLATIADRSAQELGRGALQQVIVSGHRGLIVARDLLGGRLLAALTGESGQLGLMLEDIRSCAERLEAEEDARHDA